LPLKKQAAISYVCLREIMNLSADWEYQFVKGGREAHVNHSIYSADRSTHLKIVVLALVAGFAVVGLGISTQTSSDDGYTQTARVIKAGKPVAITSNASMVR
jgi:hypothetical protein